jgi:GNAT superfamily N-acetyltransferase
MNVEYSNAISVDDYQYLRKSVGWREINRKQAQTGLNNSMFVISALADGKTVGTARIVGDGGRIMFIADVIVLPEYQGNGIGRTMVSKLMEYAKDSLEDGDSVKLHLVSAKGKESFYRQFGFTEIPDENSGTGMTQWVSKNNEL